jgi:hypothetical protein
LSAAHVLPFTVTVLMPPSACESPREMAGKVEWGK